MKTQDYNTIISAIKDYKKNPIYKETSLNDYLLALYQNNVNKNCIKEEMLKTPFYEFAMGVCKMEGIVSDETAASLINNIDFQLLKKQKHEIVNSVHFYGKENQELLDDFVSLIDVIQDYAVDVLGFPEDEIFDFEEDEPEEEK